VVYITRGLATVLLDLAREAEPESVTTSLAVTPASELVADEGGDGDDPPVDIVDVADAPASPADPAPSETDAPAGVGDPPMESDGGAEADSDAGVAPERVHGGLTPETPVFTDFYMPETAASVSAVFGLDLSTPPGQTQGRFVSHPMGRLELERTDDLHEVVFVAVPPWELESLAAFDRSGRRRQLRVVDAQPPESSFAADHPE